jgi:4-diphosphocytidyl-2C-methyl-D-erythritol kinase
MSRLPAIAALRERMTGCGAASAHLTGSGSTVIAVFPAADEAAACAHRIAADPPPGCGSGGIRILVPLASLPGVQYYG